MSLVLAHLAVGVLVEGECLGLVLGQEGQVQHHPHEITLGVVIVLILVVVDDAILSVLSVS